jgi:hypothetical protein
MTQPALLKLAYLTLPETPQPILNLQVEGEELRQYRLNRDQLYALNADVADSLQRNKP